MTDITIPPAALEAAAIELHRTVYGEDNYSWAETDEDTRKHFRIYARAACLAMLEAWPGMQLRGDTYTTPPRHYLRLPLQENPDAK